MDSVPLIGANKVWNMQVNGINLTGKGVKIGIIDTGVDYTHPDLGECTTNQFLSGICSKVVGGLDFSGNDEVFDPSLIIRDNDPIDYMGHGTHVASTAAGKGVLNGIAPDAKVYALKVFPNSYSNVIIEAIDYSLDPNRDGDFSDHLDVISLSLGGAGNPDDPMSQAIDNAVGVGVVAVVAAGNGGPSSQTIGSPGTARKAITVGASDKYDQIAGFSSRGPVEWDSEGLKKSLTKPDITAPGVNICAAEWDSAWNDRKCLDNNHISISGTSMATPHVSGAVALIKQAHPDWTPQEIKTVLRNTAMDLGLNINTQGYGRIDVNKAVLSNKPLRAEILTSGSVFGQFNIIGTAKGDGFQYYEIYYKNKDSFSWNLLCRNNVEKLNDVLCKFNSLDLTYGEFDLKLEVYGNDTKSQDQSIISVKNILWDKGGTRFGLDPYAFFTDFSSLSDYVSNSFITKDILFPITGTITGNKVSGFSFTYSKEESPDIIENRGIILGQFPIENNTIARINTSYLGNGNYFLHLRINFIDGSSFYENRTLTIEKRIKDGWKNLNQVGSYTKASDISSKNNGMEIISSQISGYLTAYNLNGNIYGNWPKEIAYTTVFMPSIGDVNGDGNQEVAITGGRGFSDRDNTKIDLINENGSSLDGWPKSNPGYTSIQPVLADLNNDGKDEIIVPSYLDNLTWWYTGIYPYDIKIDAFDYFGKTLDGWPVIYKNIGFIDSSGVVVGDINNDGSLEIIFSVSRGGWFTWNPLYNTSWDNSSITIYILSSKGKELLKKQILVNPPGSKFNGPFDFSSSKLTIADIDDDGKKEILTQAGLKLYAIDESGQIKKNFPIDLDGSLTSVAPVVGNIDSNHKGLELAYKFINFTEIPKWKTSEYLQIIEPGNPNPKLPPIKICDLDDMWVASFSFLGIEPIIYDVDNNGEGDVIISCDIKKYGYGYLNNKIYAYNKTGNLLKDFPYYNLQADSFGGFWHNGFNIQDLDNNRKADLFLGSLFFGVNYIWNLNTTYDNNRSYWNTLNYDNKNTGCYNCDKPKLSCTDSDGGYNYTVKGIVTYKNVSYTDYCVQNGTYKGWVYEYACNNGSVGTGVYDCSASKRICQDGACIFKPCSDGTPSGKCSGTKYCNNGNIVSVSCDVCGCALGSTCQKISGYYNCVAPSTTVRDTNPSE